MQIETDAFFNIGNLYYVRGIFDDTFYKNAREIFLLTIKNAQKIDYSIVEGKCYNSMGLICQSMEQYGNAISYFKKDMAICEEEKDFNGLILTMINLIKIYLKLD